MAALHHKKTNTICYELSELKQLFESANKQRLLKMISEKGHTLDELDKDINRAKKIVGDFRLVKDKEDLEIFHTIYIYSRYYPDNKVCFKLQDSINPDSISSLNDLKRSLKEHDMTDFSFLDNGGIKNFQLKAYTGRIDVNDLSSFIEKKLNKYGKVLDEINLLIPLRREGGIIVENFFNDLHSNIKTMGIKGNGHILISYNEENKFSVINTIFPSLGTTRIPLPDTRVR